MNEVSPLLLATLTKHETAAWILDATMRDAPVYNYDQLPRTRKMRNLYLFFENSQIFRSACVLLLFSLSFFEPPSYCSSERGCISVDGSALYLSGIPLLGNQIQLIINGSLLSFLIFFYYFDLHFIPQAGMHIQNKSLGALLSILVLDFAWVGFCDGYPPFRPAPYFRAILPLFYWQSLREVTLGIFAIMTSFINIFVFLFVFTFFFGLLVTLVFHQSPNVDLYFGSFNKGIYSAFTCMTTADWPMQVMGILDQSRAFALVLIFFIVIGVFLLFNVLLAVVYNAYTDYIEGIVEEKLSARLSNIKASYDFLTDDGSEVNLHDIQLIFDELRRNKRLEHVSEKQIEHIFSALDDDDDLRINRDEFLDIVDLLQMEFVEQFEEISPIERFFPVIFKMQTWQNIFKIVRSPSFTYFVDFVMITNLIIIIFESTLDLQEKAFEHFDTLFAWIECGFSAFYILEILLRVSCQGFDKYWKDFGNRLDCILTPGLLLGAGYVLFPGKENDQNILRYLVVLRCLRLFQLLADVPRFRQLSYVFSLMIPASVPLFSIFFISLYVFAAAGVELFGGLIYAGNPALKLDNNLSVDSYVENDYWVLNFNDMGAAWFTLFSTVVVTYMTEIPAVIAAASSYGDLTKGYFVLNFIVNSLIVSNCVVAFVVDLFISVDENEDDNLISELKKKYGPKRVQVQYKNISAERIFSKMFRSQVESALSTY